MPTLAFEALTRQQQLYEVLKSIDSTPIEARSFERLSYGHQLWQIYSVLGGTQERGFFERMTEGQQLYGIYALVSGAPINARQFESHQTSLQWFLIYSASGGLVTRDEFLSLTRGQQLYQILSSELAVSDPLSGISFALRLQTHRGDNTPIGLYQDTDCTIPATSEGQSIAGWKDVFSDSGIAAIQSNVLKRPVLRFVGGVPVARFDGVDDEMEFTNIPACRVVITRIKHATGSQDYAHFIGDVSGSGTGFHGGENPYMVYSVLHGTYEKAWVNGSLTPIASVVKSAAFRSFAFRRNADSQVNRIADHGGQSAFGRCWNGDYAAIAVGSSLLTDEEVVQTMTEFTALAP